MCYTTKHFFMLQYVDDSSLSLKIISISLLPSHRNMASTKSKEVADEYISSLSDLTINSKPLINMLTMLAEDNIEHAPAIVQAVETHLQKVIHQLRLLFNFLYYYKDISLLHRFSKSMVVQIIKNFYNSLANYSLLSQFASNCRIFNFNRELF